MGRKLFSRNKPPPIHPRELLLAMNGSQKGFILRNYLTLKCAYLPELKQNFALARRSWGGIGKGVGTSPRGLYVNLWLTIT